ncbi:MAG: hypothetical protein NV67_03330 [Gammaproteobacteria bacterium (ex Lamellibrachia satsuma)]|nr:MAG: hypothetical protein NV67_10230 [Gammaproteobacteria bacterium (ex Lamellibrachia satsuma)]RRS37049.1 MAG: hypothetical protein NV67_03330 [Gammaproteobacteria bacterium (ex Lamellibrachia satsuma)]
MNVISMWTTYEMLVQLCLQLVLLRYGKMQDQARYSGGVYQNRFSMKIVMCFESQPLKRINEILAKL